ncbi:hypothetical protein QUA42_03860 [Microcoleus sp. Pol11C2]|uniref:hypothetical protein n=1 Tax=Microcoleus sp. Pol11C2 TaxID=3055389 RepID=UPI002FD0A21F
MLKQVSYWDVKNLSSENFKHLCEVQRETFKQMIEVVRSDNLCGWAFLLVQLQQKYYR